MAGSRSRWAWAMLLVGFCPATGVDAAEPNPLAPGRLDAISARYLGKPYALDSLGEGKAPDKDPVYDRSRVDCQTLVEQVMVDALTEKLGGRGPALRLIRYNNREIAFENRCHYCIPDWLNLPWPARDITGEVGGKAMVSARRRIDLPRFLERRCGNPARSPQPARTSAFEYIPRKSLSGSLSKVPHGSIAVFVHERRDLVAAHVGFVFRNDDEIVLRHASQTRKKVIDEPLTDYLKRAPKAVIGMIFLQPDLSRLASR